MEKTTENFVFKTNIKCGGCVATVKPYLDQAEGIGHWEVDLQSNDRLLTVHSEGISEEEVIRTVKEAGYSIEPVTPQRSA